MLIYFVLVFKSKPSTRLALLIGFLLGFVTLIRPVNVLVILFLPMFFVSFKAFVAFCKKHIFKARVLLASLLAFFAVVSLQLIMYKAQIDQWYIYAYSHEKFFFMQPHILDFLFSIRKGFFVYAPLFIFSIFGLVTWYKVNKFQPLWWLGTFLFITYVFSSWHMWWYGGGFGTRVMIDYYIVWLLPIAFLLNNVKGIIRKLVIGFFTLMVVFVQYQTCQYRYYIIHWDGPTAPPPSLPGRPVGPGRGPASGQAPPSSASRACAKPPG